MVLVISYIIMDAKVLVSSLSWNTSVQIHNVNIEETHYKMDKKNIALIFNNFSYDDNLGLEDKPNPEKDVPRLIECLTKIGFEIKCLDDNLPLYEIKDALVEVGTEDSIGCLLVIVLSSGTQDLILAADERYAVEDLWNHYVDNQLLIGIPKIYIIETFHEEVKNDGSGDQKFVKAPSMTDYICVNSSYSDASLQLSNTKDSSRFLSALCTVLEDQKNLEKYDLLQLLTLANNQVLHSFPPDIPLKNRHVPRIISMMPKLLKFTYSD